ncbi:hypothetical protein Thermus77420_00090 [Thermus thalpophilus]|uniref:hypothetical protein n=1 Tax=Thermus sp. (strain 2.9) TaxID=1577051 RepID=UPI00068F3E97|nr:hypothetical protein [Thermus sp. 2.9]
MLIGMRKALAGIAVSAMWVSSLTVAAQGDLRVASPPDFPVELADLEALHDAGRYREVYEKALARKDAWGFILASYSATNYARYQAQDAERQDWFRRAADAAREAIKLSPQEKRKASFDVSAEAKAYFALGQALGRYVQYAGLFTQALLVNQIRSAFSKAIELAPQFPDPYIGMALWHAEGVSRNICLIFGCKRDQVRVFLDKAESQRSNSKRVVLGYVDGGYANLLIGDFQESERGLTTALATPAKTAEDKYEHERARKLMEELNRKRGTAK